MAKLIYEVLLPKNKAQLEGIFLQLFKPRQKHLIIKILNDYITEDDLKEILEKYQENIEKYKKIANWEALAGSITGFYEELKNSKKI